ncbi:MAG: glutathione peroxidase [Bacteroidetes bacterium]|nr:glutathione peroxidase [Bacteroidota bacterium]
MNETIYQFGFNSIGGTTISMKSFQGKVLLLVNTASGCGYTPQYKELQSLWMEFGDRGLVVIGFPCNQFGRQESGNEEAIRDFCEINYGVTFPLSQKIEVNGKTALPLWKWLKKEKTGFLGIQRIPWNFTKFIVDRTGTVVGRYSPSMSPGQLRPLIEKLL